MNGLMRLKTIHGIPDGPSFHTASRSGLQAEGYVSE